MFQFLLYPFSFLYRIATDLRNYLYDSGHRTSFEFDRFVLAVGNLSVGGTGKSPMIEYLVRLLQDKYKIATLSRGYGRKTRGFRIAGPDDSAQTLGDEPFQFHKKFPQLPVTVGEERAVAIPFILAEFPETEVILLDDAFQHRAVKPAFNVLLTTYDRPFFTDVILPAGRLRESRQGARRADAVVVTKCPESLTDASRLKYEQEVQKYAGDIPVFFSQVMYGELSGTGSVDHREAIIFCGIASPDKFIQATSAMYSVKEVKTFPDHHNFSKKDIDELISLAGTGNYAFITTEKDYVRLNETDKRRLEEFAPLFYLPITVSIEPKDQFDGMILAAISNSLQDNV